MARQPDDRDRRMMENPDDWPRWPYLPLKRPSKDGGWPDFAVLYEHCDARITRIALHLMEGAQLFTVSPEDHSSAQEVTVDDVMRAGWLVD